jgi:hypothetical protein
MSSDQPGRDSLVPSCKQSRMTALHNGH